MHTAECLKFCFVVYLCPPVTLLLLARTKSQIHAHISSAATPVASTGLSARSMFTSVCLLHFLPASSQGAVEKVCRLWEFGKCFTGIKFTVKTQTKGLKRLVVACREADGHANSGGPVK